MRQLHPVSFHERFVASGTYVYAHGNAATGDLEHWTLHEPGNGGLTLRADYDGRNGSGINWLFEGFYLQDSQRFERFDLSLFGQERTDARFVFTPDEAQVSLRVKGVPHDRMDLALPAACAGWPLALAGLGLLVAGLGVSDPVFVPLFDLMNGHVLGGQVETLHRAVVTSESLRLDVASYEARLFAFTVPSLGEYRLWLDRYAIPLQMQASTGLTARLTRYVHRPETTS